MVVAKWHIAVSPTLKQFYQQPHFLTIWIIASGDSTDSSKIMGTLTDFRK